MTVSEIALHAYEEGLNPKRSQVCQYTIKGEKVNTFKSIAEAWKTTGISQQSIRGCCDKISYNLTAGGYVWRYKGDDISVKPLPSPVKKILCQTKGGKFFSIYDSIHEAHLDFGGSKNCIRNNLQGWSRSAHGMVFSHISEEEEKKYLE